ncbi:MAG: Pyrroline-5-carboxylate reductase [Candidatus Celerinatantimonas neptuna]|nr:MAG: Pyrroline-5-carboxylate reductase [Candidatus Celerinatantimonas neptuna]
MATSKIVFIGAGHMATSLIFGMINQGIDPKRISACDHNPPKLKKLNQDYAITTFADSVKAIQNADIVVLAVKPQVMQPLCERFHQESDLSHKLFISIAAGISCNRLTQWLGNVPIIRCMPNLPAKIGLGVTGLYADQDITPDQRIEATQIMSAVGKTIWVSKEDAINHIIAIAGSSPAYFFLFMDAMQQYAQELGFSSDDARDIVTQTALGSVTLAIDSAEQTLATMCQNVAVKGGTTAEAIRTFEQAGLRNTVKQAMQAAIERGRQLELQL